MCFVLVVYFFFFKQKTAYEMRISDWSSDVCSSDLVLYQGEGTSMTSGNTDIDKIFLEDRVLLNSGTQQATAEKGEFDMASQTFVLTGKQVVLSDGPNVFKGCKLTVLMETGEAKLDACGGRVEIMPDPKNKHEKGR